MENSNVFNTPVEFMSEVGNVSHEIGGKLSGNVRSAAYGTMDFPSFITEPTNVIDLMPELVLADKTYRTCIVRCSSGCMTTHVQTDVIVCGRYDRQYTTVSFSYLIEGLTYFDVVCKDVVFNNVKAGFQLTTRGPLVFSLMTKGVPNVPFDVAHCVQMQSTGKLASLRDSLTYGYVLALDSFSMSPVDVDVSSVINNEKGVHIVGEGVIKTVEFEFNTPLEPGPFSKKLRIPLCKSDYVRLKIDQLSDMIMLNLGTAIVDCRSELPAVVMPVSGSGQCWGVTFTMVFDDMGIGVPVRFGVLVTTVVAGS